ETHVPVPLALWPARGAAVLVRDERPGAFDIGASRADAVLATYTLASPGPLAVQLFTEDDPLGLLRGYAALTATPALPPKWAFAPQQWRNEHRNRQEVLDDAYRMRAEGIPGSTMWIDNPWQTAYNDFTFDETRFADPQGLLDELATLGYRVLVWSTPYVNKNGPTAQDFVDARAMGYLVTDDVGAPFVFPWQDGPGSLVDFSREGATAWWRERIGRATARGISGFKLDFGEDVVPEFGGRLAPLRLAAGDAQIMHERYSELYHEAYLGALPPGDGFLITRAGTWGEQRVNTCIWPGDLDSDFSLHGVDNGEGLRNVGGLPAAIAAMLSLSASGYPFFGSDIGGFREGPPTTEVLIRWSQYAALGTIMQLGGGGESHNPWDTTRFAAPALDVYRTYSRLHMDLVPYLYSLAVIAAADGTPVTIPTRLIDYGATSDDATFYVGDALFVAPVIEAGATTREVVLPPGTWIDWWTGAATIGDGTSSITAAAPLEILPLWRRANALVPMFARAADTLEPATATGVTSYSDRAFGRELRLLVTPTGEPTSRTLYDGTRASAAAAGTDYAITLRAGDEYDIVTLALDRRASTVAALTAPSNVTFRGAALPTAADAAALTTCAAPGCAYDDTTADRLLIRVHLPDSADHEVLISQ
ncbi:MAG TPA: glycoside hydrolase family 31 protein, partial [Kofleriaceae bacterium]|nr:glycoside hydrolase family 31 protein [Kofleriaceae bacterium]